MDYNIRKATLEDSIKLDELLTFLIQDESKYDENINENFVVNNFYKNKITQKENCAFIAEVNNQIVGYIYGYIIPSTEDCNYKIAKLDALYVEESYRNQEIATNLIKEFKNWAKKYDAKYIEVNVLNKNISAYKLYKKENFEELKTTLQYKI